MVANQPKLDWPKLMNEALTAPGNLGSVYSRFHNYSITNELLFLMQGIHEPVASASRWKQLGRPVTDWKARKEVIVPQFAKEPLPEPPEGETLEQLARSRGRH